MVRKNCFDGLFCFKGDEVDNICVHKLDWTSTKTKEYLNKKKMVWKRLSKKVYFFFAIQFRRLVRLRAVTIKFFLMVKKHFKSKILLTQNILRHENILKVRKILTTQNVSVKKILTRQNNLVVQKILTSQNILLMVFFVKLLFTFSHSGKKWTAIFSLFLKIFPARGI